MSDVYIWVAAGFGLGWLPWAPGTFGACLGLPLAWWLARWPLRVQWGLMLGLLVLAVWICGQAAALLVKSDPSAVVLDEIVAFPWAVVGLGISRRFAWLLLAFVLFRILDIWKPWPVDAVEQWGGGVGIVADDVAAALMSWLILKILLTFNARFLASKTH